MAKLLTHHDKFHVHAILGLSALLHFFYRFFNLFVLGRETFKADVFSAIGLGIHCALHATSFQFHLPRERIWTMPMIWREFRVHNAIFAFRNLAGAALGTFASEWWLDSPRSITSFAVKVALVFAALYAGDLATEKFGSREKRTTNAMPYPPGTTPEAERSIKRFYAKAQFAATGLAVCGTPVLAFGSVLAIEGASLLMTLVRKGIVSATFYHVVYSLTLFIMFPASFVVLHCGDATMQMGVLRSFAMAGIASRLRIGRNWKQPWSKYSAWGIGIPSGLLCAEVGPVFMSPVFICWAGAVWSMVDTYQEYTLARRNAKKDDETQSTTQSTCVGSSDPGVAGASDEDSTRSDEATHDLGSKAD